MAVGSSECNGMIVVKLSAQGIAHCNKVRGRKCCPVEISLLPQVRKQALVNHSIAIGILETVSTMLDRTKPAWVLDAILFAQKDGAREAFPERATETSK